MKMKYDEVVEALLSERNYQLRRWGHRQPDGRLVEKFHDLFGWLTYMTHYFREAQRVVSAVADDADATEILRKVVAMAVAAMEPICGGTAREAIAMACKAFPSTIQNGSVCRYMCKLGDILDSAQVAGADGMEQYLIQDMQEVVDVVGHDMRITL